MGQVVALLTQFEVVTIFAVAEDVLPTYQVISLHCLFVCVGLLVCLCLLFVCFLFVCVVCLFFVCVKSYTNVCMCHMWVLFTRPRF